MIGKTNSSKSSLKYALVALSVIVLVGVGGFFVYKSFSSSKQQTQSDGVNFDPPTEAEKSAGDEQKRKIDEQERNIQQNQEQKDNGKKNVEVIITDAGEYDGIIEVRSFIPEYLQDGTCTLTFTNADHTITKQTPARADISSTICLNPNIKRSEFPKSGNWQLEISYSSKDATGTSSLRTVKIN